MTLVQNHSMTRMIKNSQRRQASLFNAQELNQVNVFLFVHETSGNYLIIYSHHNLYGVMILLAQLLSGGEHDFDIDDLKANTKYTGGFTENSRTIKQFWEVSLLDIVFLFQLYHIYLSAGFGGSEASSLAYSSSILHSVPSFSFTGLKGISSTRAMCSIEVCHKLSSCAIVGF